MSDTTSDTTPTQTPASAPLTGLTGAQAAIYTELIGLTEPATVVELACAAGVGKSTAGRALPLLEQRGLAERAPGGHDGPRRTPDLWYRTAPAHKANGTQDNDNTPTPAQPEPSTHDTTQPTDSATETDDSSDQTPPETTAPDTDSADTDADTSNTGTGTGDSNMPQDDSPQDTGNDDSEGTRANSSHGEEGPGSAPSPQVSAEPPTVPAQSAAPTDRRLAPGALRQMVIEHLRTHPDEAFTATRISRIIEKSSGAIANALDKLVSQGIAEQVSDRPRTFRLANSTVNNP
ncbi:hypothetical protein ACFY12_08305 [Streptomyces sp. NPDC001339]|uniref:hypothetical protein n=1 Tax=Streptomyces sp. NPDC001339 TaxID=3364563 RepID=UPI003695F316